MIAEALSGKAVSETLNKPIVIDALIGKMICDALILGILVFSGIHQIIFEIVVNLRNCYSVLVD